MLRPCRSRGFRPSRAGARRCSRRRGAAADASRRDTGRAMSANLDLVRSICSAWERGDYSSAEWAQTEIEYVRADGPAPGTYTGLAGMAEGIRDFLSAWEDFRVEVGEYRELDGERVLVLYHYRG